MDPQPTLGMCLLVAGHVMLATLCGWACVREGREPPGDACPWVWPLLAVPLLLLGLHHATGLGAVVTEVFRQEALQEGWYGARRGLQRYLALLLLPTSFGILLGSGLLLRRRWQRYLPAVLAFILLAGYGTLQMISLHDVDARMHHRWLGMSVGNWLNLLGLGCAAVAWGWSLTVGRRLRKARWSAARHR